MWLLEQTCILFGWICFQNRITFIWLITIFLDSWITEYYIEEKDVDELALKLLFIRLVLYFGMRIFSIILQLIFCWYQKMRMQTKTCTGKGENKVCKSKRYISFGYIFTPTIRAWLWGMFISSLWFIITYTIAFIPYIGIVIDVLDIVYEIIFGFIPKLIHPRFARVPETNLWAIGLLTQLNLPDCEKIPPPPTPPPTPEDTEDKDDEDDDDKDAEDKDAEDKDT